MKLRHFQPLNIQGPGPLPPDTEGPKTPQPPAVGASVGIAFTWNCSHHSVVEYLNISNDNKLLLYTRPKKDWRKPLTVELDFTLVSILAVVEKLQVITTYFWLFVKWRNDFVSWNSSDFCGITHLTLPADKFWIPEISIEEQANEEKSRTSPFLRVSSSGDMMQHQAFHLTSSCSLHIFTFPFDKQACNITVLSPMHSDKEVEMSNKTFSTKLDAKDRNLYLTNGEWKYNNIIVSRDTMTGLEMNYSTVTYQIFMQRRPILYVLNLIIPTAVLFFLDMAVSFTSASDSEKINVKITLILEVSFLSLILNSILPASSDDPPIIAKFFMGVFLLMVVSLLENYVTRSLKEMKPPRWFLKCERLISSRRKKKTSEKYVPYPDEQKEPCDHVLAGKEDAEAEAYIFLRSIYSEVKQMREQLFPEKSQMATNAEWNRIMAITESLFFYARLIFSVLFIAYIILKWRSEM
ncbi:5-hydroxytryptamine receptor 3A-like [Podarcis raffonei]|uniref:5-hydroxytryptamine receptor 3A-like n=1 Tax=Podarcis raffonei TaxID=65483 RepID=UPI0023293586|nr:5-hydroxytryptamine receptor 3A-like [Podarcis raffonei]